MLVCIMGAVQGERTDFSTCLCIGGQQWPTQSQPRCFQSGAQRRPCYLHHSGVPTHLPLSCPFCWSRTYLQRSLQKVTSQDESFMPDISGYVWERVNPPPTVCHLKVSLYIQLWIPFAAPSTIADLTRHNYSIADPTKHNYSIAEAWMLQLQLQWIST